MSTELDNITMIGMRLCAARNDSTVSAEQFVQLVAQFAAKVAADTITGYALDDDEPKPSGEVAAPAPAEPPKPTVRTNGSAPSKGGRPGKLTDADREKIRARVGVARDADGNLPKGFITGLAKEYGVSDATIYTLAPKPVAAPVPPKSDARAQTEPVSEPRRRERPASDDLLANARPAPPKKGPVALRAREIAGRYGGAE